MTENVESLVMSSDVEEIAGVVARLKGSGTFDDLASERADEEARAFGFVLRGQDLLSDDDVDVIVRAYGHVVDEDVDAVRAEVRELLDRAHNASDR